METIFGSIRRQKLESSVLLLYAAKESNACIFISCFKSRPAVDIVKGIERLRAFYATP